ncbi:MAG: Asp-tRNA(Asn)/Glu-tRNA(Gln) amidotransferase GatCAB subunit A [Actinobacteria bacterium QS_8_72_14]|nr:MAG: Asp-tRNA(Asn)/Glu-tRNA(Gln) amidotransferase GatCAB subunit A [Actinobacteria bacterium QS_8_72_14]
MSELHGLSAVELLVAQDRGEASAAEIVQAHMARIAATDERIGALLQVLADAARSRADAIDRRRAAGEPVGSLAGVPLALKDILCTRGVTTTAGSKILKDYQPPYDATVVERLADADAVPVGKANLDEFAMGSSCENSAFWPTRNPWDLGRVPGGSSGGSAAAVAAGQAPLAIGTDTGGSIRQPAAMCGVVGVKPTYGRVSRYGLIAFASSLDQVGSFARNVTDAALLLEAIAGSDPRDATSVHAPAEGMRAELDDGVAGLTVGVVGEFLEGEGLAPSVRDACRRAVDRYAALGADVVDVSLPHAPYGLPAYYLINPSEASSNLARYDGVRYGLRVDAPTTEAMMAATRDAGFGAEAKRRIMIGTFALSAGYFEAYYAQAQRVRTLIARDFEAAFADCDVLVGPTAPTTAFPLGDKTADPLAMYYNDIYAVPASLAGTPAMSLPVGTDDDGLPIGLQLMGPLLGEATMLRAARALEADLGLEAAPSGVGPLEAEGRT